MTTDCLVLAAGRSSRAGTHKLLARDRDGRTMIACSVETALRSRAASVVVVLGYRAQEVRAALHEDGLAPDPRLRMADAAGWEDGISASLNAGLLATAAAADSVLVCLGDMPWVRAETLDRLIDALARNPSARAAVPLVSGQRGNPVIWRRSAFADLGRLSGDRGARRLLDGPGVLELALDDPGALLDFDTPTRLADYRQFCIRGDAILPSAKSLRMSKIIRTEPNAILSRAVEYHGFVFTQGVVARNFEADATGQTRDILEQLDLLLEEHGTDKTRLLQAQIWLRDIADRDAMNQVWQAWLPEGGAPARACVQAVLADPRMLVEIMLTTTK